VWFHAVSVGEVIQLQKLIDHFQASHPEYEIWITTTTSTGYAVAQERFPKLQVCYFPLDFSWATRNAIARIRPDAIVLVELELWPNFILGATGAGLPVSLINGRVSDSSYRGYRRIRPLVRRLLQRLSVIAVQNQQYAERLIDLGANAERVCVTGSIKFDHVETDRGNSASQHLKSILNIQEQHPVFVAGSTQAPEESLALDCYQRLKHEFPALQLILVPRHRERFDEVARLVISRGLPLLRRSDCPDNLSVTEHTPGTRPAENPVILLDTLGELAACWGLADIAFVGGSLTSRGGQNMIEPAGYGAAVLFGPHTHNFRDVVDLLLTHHAATVVSNFDQLYDRVREFLKNPHTAQQVGRVAQQLVLDQQGATETTSQLLSAMLSRQPSPANVRAA
jgi:3-deoxy-D-manno-octulosonic-acid transferase